MGRGGINKEVGINAHTELYTQETISKDRGTAQYSVIAFLGKEYDKE